MRETMIQEALRFLKERGKFPASQDISKKKGFSYSMIKTKNEFGNWANFKKACGVLDRITIKSDDDMFRWIEAEVNKREDECWIWENDFYPNGYGKIFYNKKGWSAHRLVYTLVNGEIPKGLVVRHKCDIKNCCNPEHLEIGTYLDNILDQYKDGKGRKPYKRRSVDPPRNLSIVELYEWIKLHSIKHDTGCLNYGTDDKYQTIHRNERKYLLHRYIFAGLNNIDYSGDYVVRHRCNNKWCCNIEHLASGSVSDNAFDLVHNRTSSKINHDIANTIRNDYLISMMIEKPNDFDSRWAEKLGVGRECVQSVRLGRTWTKIEVNGKYSPVPKIEQYIETVRSIPSFRKYTNAQPIS
jgi:hypothetical protein